MRLPPMRLVMSLAVLAMALSPLTAGAQEWRPRRPGRVWVQTPPPGYHPGVPVGRGPGYGAAPYRGGGYAYAQPGYGPGYGAPAPTVRYAPGYVGYGWGWRYTPFWAPPATAYVSESGYGPSEPPELVGEFGAQAQGLGSAGVALGLNAEVEGHRLGFAASTNSLFLSSSAQGLATDALHLVSLHLTYAVIANEYGRLRLEGGLDSAFAPGLSAFGPGLGVSAVLGLGGPLALEGAVHLTPTPFTQVDFNAGLALGIGPVALRGGVRSTYFSDRGLVNGIPHDETFFGPYAGLAIAF